MQYLAGQQGGAFDPLVEYLKAIQYFGKEQKMAGVSLWDAAATLRGRGGQLAAQIEPQLEPEMAAPQLQDAVGSGMGGVRGSLRPEQMEQLIQLLMKRGMSREQAIGRIGEMR